MSRRLAAEFTYPAPVERVFELLTTAAWSEARARALGDGSQLVRREEQPGGGVVVAVSRQLPAGGPSQLQRFLPRDGRLVQTDGWGPPDGSARASEWAVDLPGAPGSLTGSQRLEPAGAGCRQVIAGQVTVSLPLVGGRIEEFLADLVHRLLETEAEVLRGLLGD